MPRLATVSFGRPSTRASSAATKRHARRHRSSCARCRRRRCTATSAARRRCSSRRASDELNTISTTAPRRQSRRPRDRTSLAAARLRPARGCSSPSCIVRRSASPRSPNSSQTWQHDNANRLSAQAGLSPAQVRMYYLLLLGLSHIDQVSGLDVTEAEPCEQVDGCSSTVGFAASASEGRLLSRPFRTIIKRCVSRPSAPRMAVTVERTDSRGAP